MSEWQMWAIDLLVVIGTFATTLSVLGILWLPDVHAKIHAAAKGVTLGVAFVVVASLLTGSGALFSRAVLVGLLLLLTAPVGSHVLARLRWLSSGQARAEESVGSNVDDASA